MKIRITAVILMICNSLFAGVWTQLQDLPSNINRYAPQGFAIDGKGYTGLGYSGSIPYYDWWQYDTATAAWTQKSDFPSVGGIHYAGSFVVNGIGYLAYGIDSTGQYLNTVWSYDPVLNSWMPKNNAPGASRIGPSAFVINSIAYVACGRSAAQYLTDCWAYDATNDTWTSRDSLPDEGRTNASSFTLNGLGYIVGGSAYTTATFPRHLRETWMYDPVAGTWMQRADILGSPKLHPVAFSLTGHAYAGMGWTTDGSTQIFTYSMYEYLPSLNNWVTRDTTFLPIVLSADWSMGTVGYSALRQGSTFPPTRELWKYDAGITTDVRENAGIHPEINLYPNPAKDFLNISTGSTSHRELTISIFSTDGKLIRRFSCLESTAQVDLTTIPSGTYIVVVTDGETNISKRLIKE